jgi:hypothetical protein
MAQLRLRNDSSCLERVAYYFYATAIHHQNKPISQILQ